MTVLTDEALFYAGNFLLISHLCSDTLFPKGNNQPQITLVNCFLSPIGRFGSYHLVVNAKT
jgi:hypothetical protein